VDLNTVVTHRTSCRFCSAGCAIEVDVEDGHAVAVRGDASDPFHGGYTCQKGRAYHDAHNHPDRLLQSRRRRPDGTFEPVPTLDAVAEISDRLSSLIDRYGPRSVALYTGTHAYANFATMPIMFAFQRALGTPNMFTPVTIDQPAKNLVGPRMGTWGGGPHGFAGADVALVMGNNPLVSH